MGVGDSPEMPCSVVGFDFTCRGGEVARTRRTPQHARHTERVDMGPLASIPAAGTSAEMLAARLGAAFGPCPHADTVPVELLADGDIVARLCTACDAQLPADWVALPTFPPVPDLPPFVPDPQLTARICE